MFINIDCHLRLHDHFTIGIKLNTYHQVVFRSVMQTVVLAVQVQVRVPNHARVEKSHNNANETHKCIKHCNCFFYRIENACQNRSTVTISQHTCS